MICCWIIPVIVGLLSALLGYLLGRSCVKKTEDWEVRYSDMEHKWNECREYKADLEAQLKDCKTNIGNENALSNLQKKYDNMEAQLAACNNSNKMLTAELSVRDRSISDLNQKLSLAATSVAAATTIEFNAEEAKTIFGKNIKENDLTIVEGIGPKIQNLFQENGIITWKALSEATIGKCKEILEKGGPNYTMHNPATWPAQAALAFEGKWSELKKWQDELDGGV